MVCIGLLGLVLILKYAFPATGQQIGKWISGAEDNRVAQAFSDLFSSLSDGEGIQTAVEVFREKIQGLTES